MRRLLLALMILSTTTLIYAQDTTTTQIDSLERRIAQLERRTTAWDKITDMVDISGFIQATYDWSQEDGSTFGLRLARLSLSGDIYKGKRGAKADYRLQVGFNDTPKVVDLWVRYQPVKAFGIQLGQFKMPTLIELTEYSQSTLEFIEFSMANQRLMRMKGDDVSGISTMGRDIGVQFFGSFFHKGDYSILNYNVAVMNGSGINTKDNNNSKDLIGRLFIKPIKGLTLGGFYQYGEGNFIGSDRLPTFGQVANPKYVALYRYGAGANYIFGDMTLRSEYVRAKTGELESEGLYLTAAYAITESVLVSARWDYFDDDTATSSHERQYTLGVNYQPLKALGFKLNYLHRHFKASERPNTNGVYVMVSVYY